MKVTFRDLGPLREATVDMSVPLTVLVGRNNTGKTYLASAMYAVRHPRAETGERVRVLEPLIRAAIDSGENALSKAAFEAVLAPYQLAWSRDVETTIPLALAIASTRPTVSLSGFDPSDFRLVREASWPGLTMHLDAGETLARFEWAPEEEAAAAPNDRSEEFALIIADYLARAQQPKGWAAQPAERMGIQVFGPELAARRFEDAYQSPYPWLIGDAVSGRVRAAMKRESPLADRLEDELLGGRISIDSDGAFGFKPRGALSNLSIREVSSSVKSIAPLSIELRGRSPAAVIIIDEPEMSLHPDLQRKFVRWLSAALREGHRFVIATHSDYIIRELSHLMMLHDASPALATVAKQRGYSLEDAIAPSDVQVLRLGEGIATAVQADRYGFVVDTIEDQLQDLAATSQDFFAAVESEEEPSARRGSLGR